MGIIQRQSIKGTLVFIFGAGIHFFTMLVVLPSLFPPESQDIAIYRVYFNLILIFSTVSIGGIHIILLKHLNDFNENSPQRKALQTKTFLLTIVIGLLTMGLIFVCKDFIYLIRKTQNPILLNYFWVVPINTFLMGLIYYFEYYSISTHRLTAPAIVKEVVMRSILGLAIYLFGTNKICIHTFFLILTLSYLLGFLILFIYCVFIRNFRITFNRQILKQINLKPYLPYTYFIFVLGIVGALIINSDQPITYAIAGIASINIYGMAVTASSMITIPYKPLSSILLPFMYDAWEKNDKQKLIEINQQSSKNLTAIGVVLFLLLLCNIKLFIPIIGQKYTAIYWPVFIIGIGRVLDYTTGTSTELIMTSPSHKKLMVYMIATFLFSLGCYIILIPRYQSIGAAISCTLTLIFYNILKYIHLKKTYQLEPFVKESFYMIVLGISIFFIVNVIPSFSNFIIDAIINSLFIVVSFATIVYHFNWLPELNLMIKNKLFNKIVTK